jgi:hypothetical protein
MTVYVRMTDKFMSGWGKAEGKVNVFVVICDDMEQAETIERNANARKEMKRVMICLNKPKARRGVYYSWRHWDQLADGWKQGNWNLVQYDRSGGKHF